MPVRNCCVGCQGPLAGPCGPMAFRTGCCGNGVGPCCAHAVGANCSAPCGDIGFIHG